MNNFPMHPIRAFTSSAFATGLLFTLALLFTGCGDSMSPTSPPALNSGSSNGSLDAGSNVAVLAKPAMAPCGLIGMTSNNGATVTYFFEGALADPFGSLAAGTPFTGSFSYNYPQPDLSPNTYVDRGDYLYNSISLTFGGTTVTDNGTGVINVYDLQTTPYPTDLFHLYTYNVNGSLGGLTLTPGAGIQLVLQDLTGTAWSSTVLPGAGLTMDDLTAGAATFIQLQSMQSTPGFPGGTFARGPLSSCVPVPIKNNYNQGVGNGPDGGDPGNSNNNHSSNDEGGGTPGDPGRKGGNPVNKSGLATITVTPDPATLAIGGAQLFTAVGTDANGNVVPISPSPTWLVVAGGGSISSSGVFTAGTVPGTYTNTVEATSGSISGTATVIVTIGPLATITVIPDPVTLAIGSTQQFAATGKDASGNVIPITPTWSVVAGGGTISVSSGLFTAGTVSGTFLNTVKATSGTISGTATVTVP